MKFLSTLLLIALFFPGQLYACRCIQKTVAEYYQKADIVFIGKASKISRTVKQLEIEFSIFGESYKGKYQQNSIYSTPLNTALCGVQVKTGQSYLVFGTKLDNSIRIDTCNGTREFDPQKQSLETHLMDKKIKLILSELQKLKASKESP